ncbi:MULTISPECIES: nitroreductase family protein [unclassified Methanoculleus]|jgi:nitroreductase|uniref:Nitroreductase family protein n=1 Tax=Methanoculleus palmolei TaxID=72612 RepID=A0ABD8A7E2_9EURY|nr:nitroreductase family protein [Methanoculleus sp. UBA377]MDD2473055.1 nitroreductase family protein [Methanoculleus sp.]WOX55441.1 nitroreductase family protein [Methanoculleus palmolei]
MSPIGGTVNLGVTVIRSRHSVRKYKDSPVEEKIIKDALDCARLAPTAKNEQPWLFGTVRKRETLKAIADLTDNARFIADAPVCFAVFGKRAEKYYLEDCCAATMQLILALQAWGVASCWVAGDKKDYVEDVRTLLNVPEDYTLVSLVPAGYPEEILIAKKKTLDEVTFFERYEEEE